VHESEPAPSRAGQRRRTEARILASASRLFVERGYERTTIREIARAAGVDGGLVMHYFGSKQELFQRVTHDRPVQELTGTADDITEQILARLADSLANEPVQSVALLRFMLTHPEAAQAMREGAALYQAQISRPITADDAGLRGRAGRCGDARRDRVTPPAQNRGAQRRQPRARHRPAPPVPALPDSCILRSCGRLTCLPGRRGQGRGPQVGCTPDPAAPRDRGSARMPGR
jgi:AcrR family transcriptional regulator